MIVSLDNRSWYSLLEGLSPPEALVDAALQLGYQALALTDVNSLMGLPAFVAAANKAGIRPLTGATLSVRSTRMVALAKSMEGYAELSTLITLAQKLKRQSGDVLAPFLQAISRSGRGLHFLVDDPELLRALSAWHPGRVWALISRPRPGMDRPQERYLESMLLEAARACAVRPVASCKVLMAHPQRIEAARVLWAIRHRAMVDQYPIPGDAFPANALPSAADWQKRFADLPEALVHARELADRLETNLLPARLIFPAPRKKPGIEDGKRLEYLSRKGLKQRELDRDTAACKRMVEEIELICRLGFAGYFLVVRSIARKATRMGLSMALRGSAGNSLICYLLGITEVDPLRFELPLERFLHEERTDLPDIDLDFDWKNRDGIIDWAIRHFGTERTCRISSHLFFQPRAAFRESCRCHGLSNDQTTQLIQALRASTEQLLAQPQEAQRHGVPWSFPLERERWWRILDDARLILGMPHHLSIHPGGIVMVPDRIERYVPIQLSAKGVDVTQFDKYGVEATGLVKIDLLGNRALATVDEIARRLRELKAPIVPISDSDQGVIDLLRKGDTLGIGQLESPAMKHLLVQMRPSGIDDLIIALALIRPGAAGIGMKGLFCARRRGKAPAFQPHEKVAEVLHGTDGMLVFEDDGLKLIQVLTKMGPSQADHFRKRIAKNHDPQVAVALRQEFLDRSTPSGVPLDQLEDLWRQLEKFNQFSFCKSHAVSYGLIAWRAAWCKLNVPVLFWTAALNNNQGMYPRRVYAEEILRSGIAILGPCINRSAIEFSPERMAPDPAKRGDRDLAARGDQESIAIGGRGAIRTGLGAIGGLNQALMDSIVAHREQNGPFRSFEDYRARVPTPPEGLHLLMKAGCFDLFGQSRPTLRLQDQLEKNAQWQRKGTEMFASLPDLQWRLQEVSDTEKCRDEFRLLGYSHTRSLGALMKPVIRDGIARLGHYADAWCLSDAIPAKLGKPVLVAGMVAAVRRTYTKTGKPMQFLTLEDEKGFVDLVLFPGNCEILLHVSSGPYLGWGTVEEDMGLFTVIATRVMALHESGQTITIQDEASPLGWREEES